MRFDYNQATTKLLILLLTTTTAIYSSGDDTTDQFKGHFQSQDQDDAKSHRFLRLRRNEKVGRSEIERQRSWRQKRNLERNTLFDDMMDDERYSSPTRSSQNRISQPPPQDYNDSSTTSGGGYLSFNNNTRLDDEEQASLDENTEQAIEERHDRLPEERDQLGDSIFPFPFGGGDDNANIFARTNEAEESPPSIPSEEGEMGGGGETKEGGDGEVSKSNKILPQDPITGSENYESHHHHHHDYFGPF